MLGRLRNTLNTFGVVFGMEMVSLLTSQTRHGHYKSTTVADGIRRSGERRGMGSQLATLPTTTLLSNMLARAFTPGLRSLRATSVGMQVRRNVSTKPDNVRRGFSEVFPFMKREWRVCPPNARHASRGRSPRRVCFLCSHPWCLLHGEASRL